MATTQFSLSCPGNYSKVLNVTGASIATVKALGPLAPWCQNAVCGARLASKTMTADDRFYPFYTFSGPYNFMFTWTGLWAWATFCLEVIFGIFQVIEIYKIDQVNKKSQTQSVNGRIRNPTEFTKETDRARGAGMWGTRWVGMLYLGLGIAEFIYILAGQFARPGALVFQTGNTILATQMCIPVLLMANGMMMFWSSFIYRHNYAELLHAKIIIPLLIVINFVIIGFFELFYSFTMNLDNTRTTTTWGSTFLIIGFLPFIFTLVHSKLGWSNELGTAQYAMEQSWSDFRALRLGLAVLWAVGTGLIGSQIPTYFNCALINVNDKVTDNMVYIGIIALYASILILLYFVYFIVTFHSAINYASSLNSGSGAKTMPCCDITTDLCCSFEASVDTLWGSTYARMDESKLMGSSISQRSSAGVANAI